MVRKTTIILFLVMNLMGCGNKQTPSSKTEKNKSDNEKVILEECQKDKNKENFSCIENVTNFKSIRKSATEEEIVKVFMRVHGKCGTNGDDVLLYLKCLGE